MRKVALVVILACSCLAARAFAQWAENGVLVCGGVQGQNSPVAIPDGTGGAIIAWQDFRFIATSGPQNYAQRLDARGVPQWTPDGVRLSTFPTYYDGLPRIAPDGAGGAIIAWNSVGQHIDANGTVLWPQEVLLCSEPGGRFLSSMVADDAGGAIVAWRDSRALNPGIYVQRVNANGDVLWGEAAVPICVTSDKQYFPFMVSDERGGAILAWDDYRQPYSDVYAQRVNPSGVPIWTINGVPVCDAENPQGVRGLVPVGGGGAIIAWKDLRHDTPGIYAQRLTSHGSSLWAVNGVPVCTSRNADSPVITADGGNGAIIAWEQADERVRGVDVYAQHIGASGKAAWVSNGVAVCLAVNNQAVLAIVPDGKRGAVITWLDNRRGAITIDVYTQRVDASGVPAWSAPGVPLWTAGGFPFEHTLIPDGSGGAIAAWSHVRTGTPMGLYANHVSANGVVGASRAKASSFVQMARSAVPAPIALSQNYPNPFSGTTNFDLMLDRESVGTIDIFDVAGRKVRHLLIAPAGAGVSTITFDGRDQGGRMLPSGAYFYRASANGTQLTRKMLILR